jgi:hypothetical protein
LSGQRWTGGDRVDSMHTGFIPRRAKEDGRKILAVKKLRCISGSTH